MSTLRIFINQAAEQAHDWWLFDRNNAVLRHNRDALSNLPIADTTEVIIPTDWVSFAPAVLPAGNRKKMLEALPYLIEDHLVTNPEQVHVVIAGMHDHGSSKVENKATLASIDKETLNILLQQLQQHGISPDRVLPAALVTKFPPDCWVMVCDGAHFFLRTSAYSGIALTYEDDDTAPIELQLALQQAQSSQALPNKIITYGEHHLALSAWSNTYGVQFEASHADWKKSPPQDKFNLLQGAFAPQSKHWAILLHAKPALVMLCAVVLLTLIASTIDWALKSYENNRLDQQMQALFLATFPEAKNVVDAPLQMQRNLNEMQQASGDMQSNDFLSLLATLTKHTGGLANTSAMHYQAEQLSVSLQAANEATAQALVQKIHLPGLMTVIENMKTNANAVTFDIVFRAEGK